MFLILLPLILLSRCQRRYALHLRHSVVFFHLCHKHTCVHACTSMNHVSQLPRCPDLLQVVVGRDPTVASNGLSSSIETPLGGVAGAGRWCAAGGRCGCRRVLFNRVTGRTVCGARPLRIRSAPAAAAEQAPGARSCGRAGHDQGEGARVICLHPPLFAPTPIAILPPPHSQMRACSLHLH